MSIRSLVRLALLVTFGVLIAAPITAAPAARADTITDRAFVDTITSRGIHYPDAGTAIKAGHQVCGLFDSGMSYRQVFDTLRSETGLRTTFSAASMIGASTGAYCAQYGTETPQRHLTLSAGIWVTLR